jgi:ankyrin repeat protein
MEEFMWISDIDFDGIYVRGFLISTPGILTNIKHGDFAEIPLGEINDWLFATGRKTYGGFTIQVMRAEMDKKDRKKHDKAWGLDFGDCSKVLVAYEQDKHPENLTEHPMSRNMKEKLVEFLGQHPDEVAHKDERGYTMLHWETIAGNKTSVEALLQTGADIDAKTVDGFTALDFAQKMGWEHLIPVLNNTPL